MKNIFIKTNRNFYLKHNTTATLISPTFISNNKSKKKILLQKQMHQHHQIQKQKIQKNFMTNINIKPFL